VKEREDFESGTVMEGRVKKEGRWDVAELGPGQGGEEGEEEEEGQV
jgi:hypothetical protein